MPKDVRKVTPYVRWLYELLFSLYVAMFVVYREASKEGSVFLDRLAIPLTSLDRLLSHWRGGHLLFPRSDAPLELTYGLWGFLTLILFICLRLFAQIRPAQTFLNYALMGVLIAGPVVTPVFGNTRIMPNGDYELVYEGYLVISRSLQVSEFALVLAALYFWRLRKWSMKVPLLLLMFHFTFWSLVVLGESWWNNRTNAVGYL